MSDWKVIEDQYIAQMDTIEYKKEEVELIHLVEYIKKLEDYYTSGNCFPNVQAAEDSLNDLKKKYIEEQEEVTSNG